MYGFIRQHPRLLARWAIGDAMGLPYEGTVHPEYRDAAPWFISDDTQLTLATCEAIVETGGVYPSIIASRFLVWFQENRITGMGASTFQALRDLSRGAHWATVGRVGEMEPGWVAGSYRPLCASEYHFAERSVS